MHLLFASKKRHLNERRTTRRMIMRTILSAMLALSVLAAVAAPASAGHADPRNPAVEIPDPSPN
jgi:cell division protein FtsB